jgi:sulfate transport system ATP-binding protein
MNAGRLEQVGAPSDVFHEPASAWVMRFLGDVNEFPVRGARGPVVGYVRPHEIELSRSGSEEAAVAAKVRRVQPAGATVRVEFDAKAGGAALVAELDERRFQELALRTGDAVYLSPRRVRVFESQRAP